MKDASLEQKSDHYLLSYDTLEGPIHLKLDLNAKDVLINCDSHCTLKAVYEIDSVKLDAHVIVTSMGDHFELTLPVVSVVELKPTYKREPYIRCSCKIIMLKQDLLKPMVGEETQNFEIVTFSLNTSKQVRFHSNILNVPKDTTHIVVDEDGTLKALLCVKGDVPYKHVNSWGVSIVLGSNAIVLGKVKYKGDWRESLQAISSHFLLTGRKT